MKDKPWIAWAIHNSVVIICFSVLAVIFGHWWISLFALIFMSDIKEEKYCEKKKPPREGAGGQGFGSS